MPRHIVTLRCKTCAADFLSEVPARTYCSVKCRAQDPAFKARMADVGRARKGKPAPNCGPERTGDEQPCANGCGSSVYRTAARQGIRTRRYCSRLCYHQHLARLFDREIGLVSTIPTLHNYDEILASPRLQCVMPGCEWDGDNLSLHMHLAHGIVEDEFKAAAGFNRNTGVISATLRQKLEHDRQPGNTAAAHAAIGSSKGKAQPSTRREAREHYEKAMAFRAAMRTA